MCTAIAYKGNDLLYGFNLDIDPNVWHYSLHKTNSIFAIGITVGKTTYFVHGVNKNGQFGNVPYMNGANFPAFRGVSKERIDLLNNRYIRGKYFFRDIEEILHVKAIVNIPSVTMHSLIGNKEGDFLIIEPGYGYKKVDDHFAVLTNFPVLTELSDYSLPFYGKDRYDRALSVLSKADDDFNVEKALQLLYDTCQKGTWATRISFVYSGNENAVYYFLDGDIFHIYKHLFK